MNALTELQLKAINADSNGQHLRDGGNLVGKVRAKIGGKISVSFSYSYKLGGRFREVSCGTWPKVSLKSIRRARDSARALLDQGIDPAERRKAAKLEARAAETQRVQNLEAKLARPTVQTVFEQWDHAELSRRKGAGEVRRGWSKDILPTIGPRFAADVKRADIMAILDGVTARGANRLANRLLAEMRQLFGFALVRELVTADPTVGIEKRHVGGKEELRDRVLSEFDLRKLASQMRASGLQKTTQHVVWTLLATSVRIGELARACRSDIDFDARTWRIPAENAKNGDAHVVYLSDFAISHLQALLVLSSSDTWLLPASRRDGHIDPKAITKQIADRQLRHYARKPHNKRSAEENSLALGDEKWTPHDLRRTSATIAQRLGALPVVIETMLNHREQNRMVAVYQHYDYATEQREAWAKIGQRLLELTTPSVTSLPTSVSS
ncbi:tyrosine-type recombinase/integrase [Burkholderia territorii]|uniref:tyrosine-type recombinase/integrase n=1 Tax=Burkholderia territorii TaxID=1503055 RepID=UPI0009C1117D|nr:site-specific integrase [Burkholderia territorii]